MVFVEKWPVLQLFLFKQFRPGKSLLRYSRKKNAVLRYKNKRSKKTEKLEFSQGVNPWFLSKNSHFPNFFLRNLNKKNVFFDILERKMRFQAIKTRSTKSRKIDVFPKGLTHGFGTKMASFWSFLFGNLNQENVFYDILERKTPFYAIKTTSPKNRKIGIYPGWLTHGFSRKKAILPTFSF